MLTCLSADGEATLNCIPVYASVDFLGGGGGGVDGVSLALSFDDDAVDDDEGGGGIDGGGMSVYLGFIMVT